MNASALLILTVAVFTCVLATNPLGAQPVFNPVPWLASIRHVRQHVCSGAILNNRWIITSARCVSVARRSYVTAHVGAVSPSSGNLHTLDRFVVHPQYNHRSTQNDIALVRTVQPIQLNARVGTIALARVELSRRPTAESLHLFGWGVTRNALGRRITPEATSTLRRIPAVLLSNVKCKQQVGSSSPFVHSTSFCTLDVSHGQSCVADAGSPIVWIQNQVPELVGIQSWRSRCGNRNPNVFSDVWQYREFISDVIRG